MNHSIALVACLILAGCSSTNPLKNISAVSADIQKACTLAQPVIAASMPFVGANPTAAATAASVAAGCTLDGMIQMTANDGKPVTPTNSGDSAAWVQQSTAFVNATAAAVQVVQSISAAGK